MPLLDLDGVEIGVMPYNRFREGTRAPWRRVLRPVGLRQGYGPQAVVLDPSGGCRCDDANVADKAASNYARLAESTDYIRLSYSNNDPRVMGLQRREVFKAVRGTDVG